MHKDYLEMRKSIEERIEVGKKDVNKMKAEYKLFEASYISLKEE